jgi:HTH-type transcriptional regulator, transcriptional repressor of NAD biosynthesis genes
MTGTRGLTLGKYAPLHKGHQLVIETALAEVDELQVIIYDSPEVTSIPLSVRAGWLRQLYPQVGVIEAWDGPSEVGSSPHITQQHEDYVLNSLRIRNITHFYSSEFYGEHMSRALHAVNRTVDEARQMVPVSATAVRRAPFKYRDYLHPWVYRDLITNIVLLGAPSTGKTTLAARLAEVFDTVWMPEYGREYWEQHQQQRRLSPSQLVEIAEGHLEREERLMQQANQYLFSDTNALTTAIFGRYYHGSVETRLAELAQQAATRYDLVFVCDTDIPYDDTWDRSGNANRQAFQRQILGDLAARNTPYVLLRGDLDSRVRQVQRILSRHKKYQNLFDLFNAEKNNA